MELLCYCAAGCLRALAFFVRNEIGWGNFCIFLSSLMTSIALGTNLWTREYFNYYDDEVTSQENPFDYSPSAMRLGAGLFSMVVEGIPDVYNGSLPLPNGVYPYTNCSQLSIYEFSSPTPTWGCRELYLAGTATFALCLVALVLYFVIFVIVIIFNGCASSSYDDDCDCYGRWSSPWEDHLGALLAIVIVLAVAIGFQLAGVLIWMFRGSPAMLDFGRWWKNQPFKVKYQYLDYRPPAFLHKLSSSFDLCCASLLFAGIAWVVFLVRNCMMWCKRKRFSSALPADGIQLPSAPSVDSDHIAI